MRQIDARPRLDASTEFNSRTVGVDRVVCPRRYTDGDSLRLGRPNSPNRDEQDGSCDDCAPTARGPAQQ